jgi:hypothetical protein
MTISANENDPVIDGDLVVWKDTRDGLRGDTYCMNVKTGKTTCVTKDSYPQRAGCLERSHRVDGQP